MAINKVVLGDTTLLDLTGDNVTPETTFLGVKAHNKAGESFTGTFTIDEELSEQDSLIEQITAALEGKAGNGDGIIPAGEISITKNGTYDVTNYASAKVEVPTEAATDPVLQSKTVTPSTSQQTVVPDSGYDGLSSVVVNAMPTAEQATPGITVSNSGLITASATQSAGYVASGTKSATKQLTTKGATTITPSTSEQVAVSAGTYVTGDIKVAAVSDSGSSDGVTVNTCSIEFNCMEQDGNGSTFEYMMVTVLENGSIATKKTSVYSGKVSNVVCGSLICITGTSLGESWPMDGVREIYRSDTVFVFTAPTTAGAPGYIGMT